jgi:hypothetical protein
MANQFLPIDQFTLKSTLTGTEEFQVSATEKVTAQQIANKVQLSKIIMSGFSALEFTGIEKIKDNNSLLGAIAILYDLVARGNIKLVSNGSTEYGLVSMDNVNSTNHGFGWLLSISEKAIYLKSDFTSPNPSTLNNIQWINTIKTGEKVSLDGGIKIVEITDFAIPGLNVTKDGGSFLFYANNASNIPHSSYGATSFVGVAITNPIFISEDQRFLYYMMVDTARGMFYTGRANLGDETVAWNDTPVTRLGQAVQVTAFTKAALGALLYSYKPGDFIPFYTSSVTASEANQFPESGVFNGFISIGRNEGNYFQIFAFKTGSPKAYIGSCIDSTTRWTQIGGSSSNLIVVADAEGVGEVVAAYKGFEGSNKYGVSVPIYIEATSNIYDVLPAIMDQGFTKNESTICGYAQYVYDGGDYYHIGLSLLIYPSSGDHPKYRAELVVNNSGNVVSSSLTPIGSAYAPIPGFTKITSLVGQTDYSLTTGSTGIINFSTDVNANTIMFIEAEIRSSAAISADVRAVCIPVSFFNPKQGAILMDLNTCTLASKPNIAQVKLNVASVITGANGVQGLNCVVISNNLVNPSDILRIKAVYANI